MLLHSAARKVQCILALRAIAPQAISFPSCGKRYGRKGRRRREIALTRLKNKSFHLRVFSFRCRRQNVLRTAHRISLIWNIEVRQIFDVWKSMRHTASKRIFVAVDDSVGPYMQERKLLADSPQTSEKCCFRAGGQRRPPLQCVPQNLL